MSNIRPEFAVIVSGWMLIDDFDYLTEKIEAAAAWAKSNTLNNAEAATIKLMVEQQVIMGFARGDFYDILKLI